jgi:capsular exopolysaccharide synthesis family protein
MQDDPHGQRAESIRRLRTNLQFVDVDSGPRSILVTSSVPSEGKTTTVVNLAVALADAGSRVLLVDADLRRPSVAPVMGLEGSAGLTSILIGQASLGDVVQPWRNGRLDVLASGPVPPNPSELLGSAAMASLLADLTATYDVVLLDSPPLLPVTDAAILSRRAGGTLVVVGTDRIHKAELHDALGALEAVDAHVLGLVLNKVAQREFSAYASSYAYSYSPTPTSDNGSLPAPQRPKARGDDGQRPVATGDGQRDVARRSSQLPR